MFKKALLSTILISVSCSSFANLVAGINYIYLSDEYEGSEIDLGVVSGAFGYKAQLNDNLYVTPEVRHGSGIRDDSVSIAANHVDVDMDSFVSLSVRGRFELDNGAYFFVAPTYTNFELANSYSEAVDDSWEFGIGGGVGCEISRIISAELLYEQFDGIDAISIGFRFNL